MAETYTFEVGQELAIPGQWSGPPAIRKIVKVTPSGRAILEHGTQVEPTLRIRGAGKSGPFEALIVTPEIRAKAHKAELITSLRVVKWELMSLDRLETIASLAIPKAEQ
jgi:hypothetical protein